MFPVSHVSKNFQELNNASYWIPILRFHHSYAPAIGVFGTKNLLMEKNVMYWTVGSAMVVWGDQNEMKDNLMILNKWPSKLNGRSESSRKMEAAVEIGEKMLV